MQSHPNASWLDGAQERTQKQERTNHETEARVPDLRSSLISSVTGQVTSCLWVPVSYLVNDSVKPSAL